MEPTVTLQSLTDRTENPSVLCRVFKSWDIIYPNNGRCLNMRYLLVDTEGSGIEAEIAKSDHSLLPVKPTDGNVYLFRRFRVNHPTSGYNATGHDYIIHMTKWTEACRIDNPTVQPPLHYFNFKELEDIGTIIRGTRVVVDVIGRIASIGPIEQINAWNGPADIRDILIENTRGKTLRITLWTTYLSLINEVAISEASQHSPVVFAFSSLELRTFNREPFLKTYSATKIYTDQTHPHIAQYLSLLSAGHSPLNVLQRRAFHSSKASKMTVPINISLQALIALEPYSNKEQQFSCIATIDGIANKDSWSYSACPECKVSTFCDGNSMNCHNCNTTMTSTIQWYRLVLQVSDNDTLAEFTLMGKQAEHVVNKKADIVFAESRRTGKMLPQSLIDICGKRLVFIVEINISQLHRQRLSYDVNKVEPIPAVRSYPPQPHMLLPNICEDHYAPKTGPHSSTPSKKVEHTVLSPQATDPFPGSPMENPASSSSSGTKRKLCPHFQKEDTSNSTTHSAEDESPSTTIP